MALMGMGLVPQLKVRLEAKWDGNTRKTSEGSDGVYDEVTTRVESMIMGSLLRDGGRERASDCVSAPRSRIPSDVEELD